MAKVDKNPQRSKKSSPAPAEFDPESFGPERFINRELSWLQFNRRVLEEATSPAHPLLERVGFLAISGSNLDEFFMVRVAGLAGQKREGIELKSQDGLSIDEQLKRIQKSSREIFETQGRYLNQLRQELCAEHIEWLGTDELTKKEHDQLADIFIKELFPILTPLAVDPAHPFPFIPNRNLCLALQLRRRDGIEVDALVRLPPALPRFISLKPEDENQDRVRLLAVEDVILLYIERLFPGHQLIGHGLFRVIRDSEIEIHEESEDLVMVFENLLRKRRRGRVIHLETSSAMPSALHDFVCHALDVRKELVTHSLDFIGFCDLDQLKVLSRPELRFPRYKPRYPERVKDNGGDIFATIRQKDFVVHHPYESFDVVLDFLHQAAEDPNVVAIKQTLYRTSNNSPIVKALIKAADSGKSVTAVVELKARFDEEANIRWSRDLERAGVQVVYGFIALKTHAKLSLVLRREKDQLVPYVHIGTGNYHPITARTYTDLSFFSADQRIAMDIAKVFNLITGYADAETYELLSVSPQSMRQKFMDCIEREIALARRGKPASIWMKMNALVDEASIDALYRASQAGVEIDLVVRGICCLRPGIPGLSERIRVKSIIGRYLEHARVYCFGGGEALPSKAAKVFIASADLMQRNLDRRVEVMIPILNETVHAQVLGQIMQTNIDDRQRSWHVLDDGTSVRVKDHDDPKALDAHTFFMTNPSLSGVGSQDEK